MVEVNDMEKNMKFFTNIKDELRRTEIYVYTPKGDVFELPYGSTPIDFAYKIHIDIGNTMVGAFVNDESVKNVKIGETVTVEVPDFDRIATRQMYNGFIDQKLKDPRKLFHMNMSFLLQ